MSGMTLDLRQNWMRCNQPRPYARVQLVCFPPAGAGAGFYRTWKNRLPATVELHTVQYPGREDRIHENCIDDLHLLADLVADALACSARRPLALFGHGLGAAIAFEVAVRLEQRKDSPLVRLFVSGRLPYLAGGALHSTEELLRASMRLGGMSNNEAENQALRTMLLPTLRSDYRMSETYRPTPGSKLRSPIAALVGSNDADVSMDQVREWSKLTHGAFYARCFPGDHFYLMPNPGTVIAELLRSLGLADMNPPVWPLHGSGNFSTLRAEA